MASSQNKRFSLHEVSEMLADSDSDFDGLNEDSDFDLQDDNLDSDSDDCFGNLSGNIPAGSNTTDDEIDNPQQSEAEEQFAQNIRTSSTPVSACRRRRGRTQGKRDRTNYQWGPATRNPDCQQFLGLQGPTLNCNVEDVDNVIEIVTLFFPDYLFDVLVTQTNLYADQYFGKADTLSKHSRARARHPVNVNEIKVWLGLTILTGLINKKGDIASYWTTDVTLSTPFFSQMMS